MINHKQSRLSHKIKTHPKQCDLLCFQQCSDKYDELIVVRGPSSAVLNEQQTKLSLKKTQDQRLTRLPLNNKSQSQKDLHQTGKIRTSTNRSRQSGSGNVYDIQLFRKKNKIETEINQIKKQMEKLSQEYQNRLTTLIHIKDQIKDRQVSQNTQNTEDRRQKITSILSSKKSRS